MLLKSLRFDVTKKVAQVQTYILWRHKTYIGYYDDPLILYMV